MAKYEVARLDEIDEITDGRQPWRPVRHHLGITAFGATAWTGREAGDRIINEHDEADEDEELYVVLSGRARFELDGDAVDAPAGTFVFAQPGVKRTAFAEEPGTTLVAIGAPAGQAYQASGWELWAPLDRLYEAGEYAEAADRGRALVEAQPTYPTVLYNVACCESLAGRKRRRDRTPRAGDRAERPVPRVRAGGLGLRLDPRRAAVPGARRRLTRPRYARSTGDGARLRPPGTADGSYPREETCMSVILGVAAGGALGALSRYGVDAFVERRTDAVFPWATFLINVSGCLAVGFLIAAIVDRHRAPEWLRVGLVLGFCGGYTTFSTFAQEALDLLETGKGAVAFAAIAANVLLGLAAVFVGLRIGRLV